MLLDDGLQRFVRDPGGLDELERGASDIGHRERRLGRVELLGSAGDDPERLDELHRLLPRDPADPLANRRRVAGLRDDLVDGEGQVGLLDRFAILRAELQQQLLRRRKGAQHRHEAPANPSDGVAPGRILVGFVLRRPGQRSHPREHGGAEASSLLALSLAGLIAGRSRQRDERGQVELFVSREQLGDERVQCRLAPAALREPFADGIRLHARTMPGGGLDA